VCAGAGGGYIVGDAASDAPALSLLQTHLRALGRPTAVLSIEYSLAPEYPYPRALRECVAAYDHVVNALRIPPGRVVLGKHTRTHAPRCVCLCLCAAGDRRMRLRACACLSVYASVCVSMSVQRVMWFNIQDHACEYMCSACVLASL
jgi:hypothetical protein